MVFCGPDLTGIFITSAGKSDPMPIMPEIVLVKVDNRISDSEAAGLQSLSGSIPSLETAEVRMVNSVAILGEGSMGLECVQIAQMTGAGRS